MCYIIKQMKKKEICFEVNLFTNTYCTLDIIDDLFNFIEIRSDEFLENFNISYRNICKKKIKQHIILHLLNLIVEKILIQYTE